MAVDIRIEQFGIDIFRFLWNYCGIESTVLARPKVFGNKTKYDCTLAMVYAVYSRNQFYKQCYGNLCQIKYDEYSKNGVDFYYFCRHSTWRIPYLNIFDKLFMTCAFVVEMSFCCKKHDNNIYKYIGPLCWTMYFETKYKEEFYDAGGWEELVKYAEAYNSKLFQPEYLIKMRNYEDLCKLYENANLDYHFEEVFKLFWKLDSNNTTTPCCTNCVPMLYVFRLRYKANELNLVDEKMYKNFLKSLEGFLQIFMKMLSSEVIEAMKEEIKSSNMPSLNVELDYKDITTAELCKRLFANVNPEKLNFDPSCKPCIFCGKRIDCKSEAKCYKSTDSGRIENIKCVIQKAVIKEKSSENLKRKACVDPFDELEERVALRLFSCIGMKSGTIKMLANINEEFGAPENAGLQGVLCSMTTIESKDETNKNLSKNKRKKM